MALLKAVMKSKYETELKINAYPQSIKKDKYLLQLPQIHNFDISTNKAREIRIKITFKNNIFTR